MPRLRWQQGSVGTQCDHGVSGLIRFRGDVEGLRAVAVLLVVFDHLQVPGFRGGFVGVDVFFVVSGYLITSLLAAEYAKRADENDGHGSISIPGFYLRRARRILPAALTVIVAVAVAARLLLNQLRVEQIQHDALWALLFGSNINSINQATDYFAEGLAASPFQHYWSLAVEEQFYLVWPALFLLVTLVHGFSPFGLPVGWRARVGITIGAVGLASLTWSIVATTANPVGAYFSTLTRAWELALGALIGITATRTTRVPRSLAVLSSFGGTALLVLACVLIDTSTAFPGTAALLPTLATALFIVGGMTASPPLPNRVLCLAPLRFLGRISYSVYLWHWPLVVFAAALVPATADGVAARVLILALTLVISTVSFYLVEQPGRRISFARRGVRPRAGVGWFEKSRGSVAFGSVVLVALFVGALSTLTIGKNTTQPPAAYLPQVAASAERAAPPVVPVSGTIGASRGSKETSEPIETAYSEALRAWQQEIRAGLAVRILPASLQPLHPHLVRYVEPWCNRKLAGIVAGECVVGNPRAEHVAVLTGDSHAGMFQVALARALNRTTWSLHIFQRGHCGWAGSVGPNFPVSAGDCRVDQAEALSRIRALQPDLLVLSEEDVVTPYRTESDISASLASFSKLARRIIVFGHTPSTPSFDSCLSGSADISGCVGTLSSDYRRDVGLEQQLATRSNATFVDTSAWFCVRVGSGSMCPPVIENAAVWRDGTHVTSDLEPKLIPLVRALLESEGITTDGL